MTLPSEHFMPLRVLYVDDDLLMHDLMRGMLNRHEITSAYSMEHAQRILEYLTPDLVFCDLMMPLDNGISVMRYLRDTPKFAHLPIIVVSAADESMLQVAKDFNPIAILQKPVERATLNRVVDQVRGSSAS
ncbi:MAG: response regulator [Anaerolineae bacterium]|nr:response regulator [Anaerolineae bacterium]